MASEAQSARVMIASTHAMFCETLVTLLREESRHRILEPIDDPGQAHDRLASECPEILLVDLQRPSDTMTTMVRVVRETQPEVRVVLLGVPAIRADVLELAKLGIHGYLSDASSLTELITTVDSVLDGDAACAPRVAFSMYRRLAELSGEQTRRERFDALTLTPRELEVLELIAEGLTNKRIAERLFLSVFTVKNHVHRILDKLDVEHRAEAVEYARRRRWLRFRRH
ncbi:MAG: response regulator transcription factor [Acidobacteriota bacterium]